MGLELFFLFVTNQENLLDLTISGSSILEIFESGLIEFGGSGKSVVKEDLGVFCGTKLWT